MEKALKILKINFLSICALPLLLIATASKLISKALEKVSVIISMLFLMVLLIFGFEIFENPESGFQAILFLLAFVFMCGLLLLIGFLLMHLAAAIITSIWKTIVGLFDKIYQRTYVWFLKLHATCEKDYQYISLNGKKVQNALLCLFYMILHFFNKLIVTVISFALPGSIILSVIFVVGRIISAHNQIKSTFDIGLLDFIKKFDTYSIIYSIVLFTAMIAMVVIILISLGVEWFEWAQELRLNSKKLAANIAELQKNELALQKNTEATTAAEDAYIHNVEEHMANLESLGDLVEEVLNSRDNALLRSAWGSYFRNLSEIVDECSKYKEGIPLDKFKRLVPRIQQLEKQRDEVKSLAIKLQEISSDPVKSSLFFAGCDTEDKLEKRYKSLCKAYHPDAEGGDTDTFQRMQEEYAMLKEHITKE